MTTRGSAISHSVLRIPGIVPSFGARRMRNSIPGRGPVLALGREPPKLSAMRQVLPVECRSFACPLQDLHREPPGRFGDPRFPGLVTPIRLPENCGKRGALAEGLRRARGEIVVTVDSDSMIERGALLAIAGPFRDPRVGAVAGKVAVHNRRANLIPRMLHVRFILSFDLLRSAQSVFRTVYCCPGALAAYRACVVLQVLCEWERQTF